MILELTDFYKSLYEEILNGLQYDLLFDSHVHGVGHIERTINLGAHIAQNEGLDEHETRMLLLCCAYHDIGRHTDWYDPVHGTASATRIRYGHVKDQFDVYDDDDMAIIQAAISAHSDHDDKMEIYEASYAVENHERFLRIAMCLKDADGLDRVRLNRLDPSYLRHEKSVKMVGYAWKLLDEYNKTHQQ